MYLAGVSVRRVEDITEALWGTKVSPATVSELNKKAYVHMKNGVTALYRVVNTRMCMWTGSTCAETGAVNLRMSVFLWHLASRSSISRQDYKLCFFSFSL